MEVVLNATIFLQQLHVNLLISTKVRDGHKWFWKNDEFPLWSVDTYKRSTHKTEESIYLISIVSYSYSKMDKIKWYCIYCPKMQYQAVQHAPSVRAKSTQEWAQFALTTECKMPLAITKEY